MEIILCYSDVSIYILKLMPSGQITPSITFYNVYKLSLMPSRQMTPNITFNKSKKPRSRFRNWLYFTLLLVYLFSLDSTYTPDTHSAIHKKLIRCFESFSFRQNFVIFVRQDFDGTPGTELPVSMYTTKTPIDMCRFNVRSST